MGGRLRGWKAQRSAREPPSTEAALVVCGSPAHKVTPRRAVAQILNLPYRRFGIGRTWRAGHISQVKNLRYSRLQVCATGAPSTLNTYPMRHGCPGLGALIPRVLYVFKPFTISNRQFCRRSLTDLLIHEHKFTAVEKESTRVG